MNLRTSDFGSILLRPSQGGRKKIIKIVLRSKVQRCSHIIRAETVRGSPYYQYGRSPGLIRSCCGSDPTKKWVRISDGRVSSGLCTVSASSCLNTWSVQRCLRYCAPYRARNQRYRTPQGI